MKSAAQAIEEWLNLGIDKAMKHVNTKKWNTLLRKLGYVGFNDTGYGYIQFQEHDSEEKFKISKVKTFTEKPNLEMAKFFLKLLNLIKKKITL